MFKITKITPKIRKKDTSFKTLIISSIMKVFEC